MYKETIGVILFALSTLAYAQPAYALGGEICSTRERRTEESLLHRRVDLGGLVQLQRDTWQKLTPPDAPLFVLNLWSRTCKPCLEELPVFRGLMQAHAGVPFLFVADPPLETSRDEVTRFWAQPLVELSGNAPCYGQVPPRGGAHACLLSLPQAEPARSEDARLARSLGGEDATAVRPITLLVDRSGVVREAFVGSVLGRVNELGSAITRLRGILAADPPSSRPDPTRRKGLSKSPFQRAAM